MTDDARFDDLYDRINEMTLDIANLKIRADTAGNTQLAVVEVLNMTSTLTRHIREVKTDVRELKVDIREINSRLQNLEASARNTDASINEILRLLRERNTDNPQA